MDGSSSPVPAWFRLALSIHLPPIHWKVPVERSAKSPARSRQYSLVPLNPKAAAIFVAVVPQFIEPGDPPSRLAAMVVAFVVMVVIWLNGYGFLVARAATHFGPQIWRTLEGLAGALLVGIGALLVVERR